MGIYDSQVLFAKCTKCDHTTPYKYSDLKDKKTNVVQTELFSDVPKKIVVGVVTCNNCGSEIWVMNKKDRLKHFKQKNKN